MKPESFILIGIIVIGACFFFPLEALENLRAGANTPLFCSYIAPFEKSDYFVDEGYHLVYYNNAMPLKLVNESSGEFSLVFKLGNVTVGKIDDYFQKPVVTLSYPDMVILEAEPFVGLKITLKFALPTSASAAAEILYKNETDKNAMIYFVYGNPYQKINCTQISPAEGCTISYKEPGRSIYFQQDTLAGFEEQRFSMFRFNKKIYAWGGFTVYKEPSEAADIASRYEYLNGSMSGDLAECVLSFDLLDKYGTLKFVKTTVQKSKEAELKAISGSLLQQDPFESILAFNRDKLGKIPAVRFADETERLLYYGAIYLGRQQFLPAAGQLDYPYYVFSREPTWGWGHEGQVLHESLSMQTIALFDPELAIRSQYNFMKVQEKNGYIPYRSGAFFTREFPANGEKSTTSPFFCWTNLEVYLLAQQSGHIDPKLLDRFLSDSYESGKKFVQYLFQTRDKNKNGLLEWGGHTLLECVRDYLNAVFDLLGDAPETLNQLEALDLNCMVVKEMTSLQKMAELLGKKTEAEEWNQRAKTLSAQVNKTMWDEETGFYYHVHRDTQNFTTPQGQSLKRKEIIGLLPLWAGIASKTQAEKLLVHLKNPDEFRRKFGVPTLSAADPYYDAQVLGCCRWNGPVWITWIYLIFQGTIQYDKACAEEILVKMENAMTFQLQRNHRFWESYSPDFTQLNSPKNYIWDTLISRMIYDIRK